LRIANVESGLAPEERLLWSQSWESSGSSFRSSSLSTFAEWSDANPAIARELITESPDWVRKVLVSGVSVVGSTGPAAATLARGVVEPGSCEGSGVELSDLFAGGITHELGGDDALLGGPLGVGIGLTGSYITGDAENPDYPECLATLTEDAYLRVCFAENDREANIQAILDSEEPRPPGETIWIGRFDEEVVAP